MRGVRIQNIVNELNGEKTDIVAWDPDEPRFVANSLSPAKVKHVWLDPDTKTATVVVPDNQLSLAIGKEGQNARLAAKLTNWRIDIKNLTEAAGEAERRAKEEAERAAREAELVEKRAAAAALLAEAELSLVQEEKEEIAVAVEAAPAAEVETAEVPDVEEVTAEEAALVVEERTAEEEQLPTAEALPEKEAAEIPSEAPGEAQEQVMEPGVKPVPAEEAELVWELDEADGEEVEDQEEGKPRRKKKKRLQRDLVYDEETGTVVSRKRRKTSRQVPEWEKDMEW
jgi:N utilization substance protein A